MSEAILVALIGAIALFLAALVAAVASIVVALINLLASPQATKAQNLLRRWWHK